MGTRIGSGLLSRNKTPQMASTVGSRKARCSTIVAAGEAILSRTILKANMSNATTSNCASRVSMRSRPSARFLHLEPMFLKQAFPLRYVLQRVAS
jgi:hypothetical protein